MEQAQALLLPKVEELKARFGTRVYGVDVSSLEEVVEDLLPGEGPHPGLRREHHRRPDGQAPH